MTHSVCFPIRALDGICRCQLVPLHTRQLQLLQWQCLPSGFNSLLPRRCSGSDRKRTRWAKGPLAFGKGSVGPSPELWSSTPDLLRPFCAMALAARQRVGLSTPGTTFSQVLPPPRRPRPRCLSPRPSANASFADRAFGALLQREPRPRAPRLSDPLGRGGRRRWCGRGRASGLPPRRRAGGPPMAAPFRRCSRIRR